MKKYAVYQHPLRGYEAVKRGFSWPAFWFSWIWAFIKRLPRIGVSFLVAIAVAMILDQVSGSGFVFGLITVVVLALVGGSDGNDWRVASLQRRGYKLIGTVSAKSPDGAIAATQILTCQSYPEADPAQSSRAVALTSGLSGDHSDSRPRRACPFCAELILVEARICRYCQRELPPQPAAAMAPPENLKNPSQAKQCDTEQPPIAKPSPKNRPILALSLLGVLTLAVIGAIATNFSHNVPSSASSKPEQPGSGENGRPWPGTYTSIDSSWNSEAAKNKQADAPTETPMAAQSFEQAKRQMDAEIAQSQKEQQAWRKQHRALLERLGVTMAGYRRLRTGMTYKQVVEILGSEGTELSKGGEDMGAPTALYVWDGEGGHGALQVMFQNGRLAYKWQLGLP